eukprot:SAG11_NODE_8955_length_959_cov_1.132558_2_plen_168_part_01
MRSVLSEAVKQQQLALSYTDQRALQRFVLSLFEHNAQMKASVDVALECWKQIQASLAAEAQRRHIDTDAACDWVDAAELLVGTAELLVGTAELPLDDPLFSSAALERIVSEAVGRWEGEELERNKHWRRQNLAAQSVWDPSANETERSAIEPEPEPEPEPAPEPEPEF